jgi:prevent-host-death family protein
MSETSAFECVPQLGFLSRWKPVTVHAAKTHLSKLIERACAGEDVVIARGRTPVVGLVPVRKVAPRRRFGAHAGSCANHEGVLRASPAG